MSPEKAIPPPPTPEIASTAAPSLPRVIEVLTKMSAAFAVFGYLSLRSHLNTLGISSTGSFGIERYLAELPEIVGIVFLPLLALGIPLALVCVLVAFGMFLRRRIPVRSQFSVRVSKISDYLLLFAESIEAPILVSAGILLLGWFTLMTQAAGGSTAIGLAVGDLTHSRRPDGWASFFVILYGCAVAYLLCHACRRLVERQHGRHANLWYLPMGLIACVALQLPILYGRILHNSEYAKVQVTLPPEHGSSQPASVCGLMLLRENSDLLLWQAQNTVGSIRTIPVSEMKQLVSGESADIWDLIDKAGRSEAISLCPAGSANNNGSNP